MKLYLTPPAGWNDMATAPKTGPVILLTVQGFVVKAQWETGFTDENGEDIGAWCAAEESQHPLCWSEGACWRSNVDDVESDQPAAWLPFPKWEQAT